MRDTVRLAAEMADRFKRRWAEPPPLGRERPPTLANVKGAETINSSGQHSNGPDLFAQRARDLEGAAANELRLGRIRNAARLIELAAGLRLRAGRWA